MKKNSRTFTMQAVRVKQEPFIKENPVGRKLTAYIKPERPEKKIQTEVDMDLWIQVNEKRKKQKPKLKIKEMLTAMFLRYVKEG